MHTKLKYPNTIEPEQRNDVHIEEDRNEHIPETIPYSKVVIFMLIIQCFLVLSCYIAMSDSLPCQKTYFWDSITVSWFFVIWLSGFGMGMILAS